MPQTIDLNVNSIEMPVGQSAVTMADGISFGQRDGYVCIIITCKGLASYVWLKGEGIDEVGGLMADCVLGATRAHHPSLGGVQ